MIILDARSVQYIRSEHSQRFSESIPRRSATWTLAGRSIGFDFQESSKRSQKFASYPVISAGLHAGGSPSRIATATRAISSQSWYGGIDESSWIKDQNSDQNLIIT
jgi:hypothetical protein